MKRLSYAMIGGAGGSFIGPIHRMAIRMDDLADLAAGAFSRNPEANAAAGVACGVDPSRVYSDWRALIAAEKGRIDFVAVCTPNDSHYAIAKAALEADLDVMCEKPLSITLEEATALEALAQARGRVLAIPFTYSGFPMVKLARDLVAKGELGRIDKVVLEYLQGSFRKIDLSKPLDKRNAWKMDPARSGKSCVVADIGVHGFHLIEYVTGLEVTELLADLSSYVTPKMAIPSPSNAAHRDGSPYQASHQAINQDQQNSTSQLSTFNFQLSPLDDDATIIMKLGPSSPDRPFPPKATLSVSKVATGEENGVRLRVYGDKASLFWNQEAPNYLSVKSPFEPERIYKRKAPYMGEASAAATRSSRIPAGHHEGFIEAFANIYDEFCAAIRDRQPHDHPGAKEGVRTMRFVEAALQSQAEGNTWVKMEKSV